MFKSILVPIDLNHEETWTRALPLAVRMAQETGAALHVMTVVPDFGSAMVQGYFPADFESKALPRAQAELERIVAEVVPPDQPCKVRLHYGSIRKHILDEVERAKADLIILAAHQPDQVRDFLVGSYADWIVRRAPASVFVVRDVER